MPDLSLASVSRFSTGYTLYPIKLDVGDLERIPGYFFRYSTNSSLETALKEYRPFLSDKSIVRGSSIFWPDNRRVYLESITDELIAKASQRNHHLMELTNDKDFTKLRYWDWWSGPEAHNRDFLGANIGMFLLDYDDNVMNLFFEHANFDLSKEERKTLEYWLKQPKEKAKYLMGSYEQFGETIRANALVPSIAEANIHANKT